MPLLLSYPTLLQLYANCGQDVLCFFFLFFLLKIKLHKTCFYELSSWNVQQSDAYPFQTTENITYKIISNHKGSGFCLVLNSSWQNILELTVAVFFLHKMLTYYWSCDVYFLENGWNLFTIPFAKCLSRVLQSWLLNQLFKFNFINIKFYLKNG